MEKRDACGNISLQHVAVVDQEKGEFSVRSQRESTEFYRVAFGTDADPTVLPSCECYDWERNRLPCKHFFAVFSYPCANNHPHYQQFDVNTDVFDDSTLTSQPAAFNDLPQKNTNHRTEAARSTEILGQIKNLTYAAEGLQDGKLLEKLDRKLKKFYQFFKDSAPKDNGITLEVPPPQKLTQHPQTYKRYTNCT